MTKKNIVWAAVFLLVIAASVTVILVRRQCAPAAKTAKILVDGQTVQTVDLQNVTEPYEFTIENGRGGENTIRVEKGKIAVIHANCPDKVCVNQGFISDGTLPVVCLPNRLSVVITDSGGSDVDAVAGGDAG